MEADSCESAFSVLGDILAVAIPVELGFGTFVGRFVQSVTDSTTDPDYNPDLVPLTGTATFTPSVDVLKIAASDNPLTIIAKPVQALINNDGYLTDSNGRLGVDLIATDSLTNPTGFGWNITIKFNTVDKPIVLTNIELPTGYTVDITQALPVDPSLEFQTTDAQIAAQISRTGSASRGAVLSLIGTSPGNPGGGTGAVASVNGRVGFVTGLAEADDLSALASAQSALAPKASPSFTGAASFSGTVAVPVPTATNHATTKKYVDDLINGITQSPGSVPDATAGIKGKLALTNMLGGSADAPTVPVLLGGSSAQYFRGDRTWQTLNVAAVSGLQALVDTKQDKVTPGTTAQYLRGDMTWASVSALPITQAAIDADTAVKTELDGGRGPATSGTWSGSVSLSETAIKGSLRVSLSNSTTLLLPSMSSSRDASVTLYITQGTGGSKTITWPTAIKWDTATKPVLSTAAGAIDVITLMWNGLYWTGVMGAKGIA